MSILIKGMEMPKDGETVTLTICADGLTFEEFKEPGDVFHAVPVPPHGRLVDADKFKEEFPHDEDWDYPVNTNSYVVETIDKSPTIIEAEEDSQ